MIMIVAGGVTTGQINKIINDGVIKNWEVDSEGDYSHVTPSQTFNGFLRPSVSEHGLKLTTIAIQGETLRRSEEAALCGRFTEMMMSHFVKVTVTVG